MTAAEQVVRALRERATSLQQEAETWDAGASALAIAEFVEAADKMNSAFDAIAERDGSTTLLGVSFDEATSMATTYDAALKRLAEVLR